MNKVYILRLMLLLQLKLYVTAISDACLTEGYCPDETKHLACTKIKGFSKNCGPMKHTFLPVNGFLKENILQNVNVLRNLVASGLYGTQPAGHMPAIAWDKYLANMAQMLTYYCDQGDSVCLNSKKYNYVATVKISGIITSKNIASRIVNIFLPIWFNDVLGCQMDANGTIVSKSAGSCLGHYTPLIEENGNRIGCAIRVSIGKVDKFKKVSLICNFSRANVNGTRPYQISSVPGSQCAAGLNPIYKFLCHPKEVVNCNFVPPATKLPQSPLE